MKELEIPEKVVTALNAGSRPAVTVTLNGHSCNTRVAKLRGRYLIGLSNTNRKAAHVQIGELVSVEIVVDTQPRTVVIPADHEDALRASAVNSFVR